jgi:amino-acid N-acetyltransferase
MNVSIVPATAADLPEILSLLDRAKLPQAGVPEHLADFVVAHEGGRMVGCAALERYGSSALLRSVAVDVTVRGLGLGQQLTKTLLDRARQWKLARVYLLTETAQGFFPRFGFRPIQRTAVDAAVKASVEFTSACPDSAVVMALDLSR